jgi:hypothetical protein
MIISVHFEMCSLYHLSVSQVLGGIIETPAHILFNKPEIDPALVYELVSEKGYKFIFQKLIQLLYTNFCFYHNYSDMLLHLYEPVSQLYSHVFGPICSINLYEPKNS